jgi:hypothetical protein
MHYLSFLPLEAVMTPELKQLAKFLRYRPRTAKDIAEKFQVTKPTAYAMVNKLLAETEAGRYAEVWQKREARRGPTSSAYLLRRLPRELYR